MDRVSPNSLTNQEEGEVAETAIATEEKQSRKEEITQQQMDASFISR